MSAKRLAVFLFVLGLFFGFAAWMKEPSAERAGAEEAARPVVVRVPVSQDEEIARTSRQTSARAAASRDDGRSVAQRIRDATLTAKIKKALAQERSLRAFVLEPVVVEGAVVIRGSVQTSAQRAQVAQVVRRVEGVREVQNEVAAEEGAVPALVRQEPRAPEPLPAPSVVRTAELAEALAAESHPSKSAASYHTVEQGESLWVIAQRYDTSVERVKQLNQLSSNNIRPGQELRVR